MEPVSAVASVIAIYQLASIVSGLCFHYSQGVRRADRDADLVINEIDIFQRYLRSLKEALDKKYRASDGVDRLQNLKDIVFGESAALSTCRSDLEGIKTKLVKVQSGGRLKETIHRISWPLEQDEVKRTLKTLKKFTEAVDRALNVDSNEILRGIDSRTEHIQRSLGLVELQKKRQEDFSQQSQEQRRAEETKEKILDWLAYRDPSEIHEIARRDRNDSAKTGRWFLDGPVFQEFRDHSQSVLWLHGDSGCGKSVLCSAIIDEILALQRSDSITKLAYWYFTVTDKRRTSFDGLLRALVAQLILNFSVPPSLQDLWKARKMGREAPKMADLIHTIRNVLVAEPSHSHFVIIDALDESDETERAELMRLIRSLALLDADIHILVTSRTYTLGVEKGMKDISNFHNVAIEGQKADLDISAHVKDRLDNDDAFAKWSPELRQVVNEALVSQAGGMFRWVNCQLQAVQECRKPAEVRKALKALPVNLHEIYARDLAKVKKGASQDVLRLLDWVAFPQLKLRIEEAIEMLAVDMQSDPPIFDVENRIVDPDDVVKMCGSLVRLDTNAWGLNEITAAHTSVIDFLTTQPVKIGLEEVVRFSKRKSNIRMAETCLVYLSYLFDNDITLTEGNLERYPFARLSARIWDDCYREALDSSGREDMARLNGLVMNLFSSPTATLNWIKFSGRYENTDWSRVRPEFVTEASHIKLSIYFAACFGFPDIVKSMIQEGYPVDGVFGPDFDTPLVAACAMGRTNVVSLLLDSGADPNFSGRYELGAPIAAAIDFDEIEIVHLLLGAKGIDLKGRRHPPCDATEEVLKLIVEYDFLRSLRHKHRKSKSRCLEIGTKLVEVAGWTKIGNWGDDGFWKKFGPEDPEDLKGSPPKRRSDSSTHYTDPKDNGKPGDPVSNDLDDIHYENFHIQATAASEKIEKSSESMVYLAIDGDTVEILKILLAAGSDPNTLGGIYGTALQKACAYGKEEAVRTLLENGARHDVYGGYHGSSLNAAYISGTFRCVELLIEAGADVNRCECFQLEKPLVTACAENGRFEMANVLIKAGADVHRTDIVGRSALLTIIASRESKRESFEYLIGLGADPLQKDKRGCDGLHYAARAQRCDVVKKILEYAVNVNVIDLNGWSPLHWAVASVEDSTEILSLLLQCGCDKSIRDKQGRTALNLATLFKRSEETVILGGSAQMNLESLEDERPSKKEDPQLRPENNRLCDGCGIARLNCKPDSWHRCEDCWDFDFCFRCILDKDIIHSKDHIFLNEPA